MSIVPLFFGGGVNKVIFNVPGDLGTYTVPSGFTSITVKIWGGGGGSAGGYSQATTSVIGGDTVKYLVGEIAPNTGRGNASAVGFSGSVNGLMIVGGGGDAGNYYGGAGGGGGAAQDAPDIPGGYSFGGKGAEESGGAGVVGLGGSGSASGNSGMGPFSDWAHFPTTYDFLNGGDGGPQTGGGTGAGGTGGNGFYGGGGGGGGYSAPDDKSSGGGGGCGYIGMPSGISSATGDGVTGLPGNSTDSDRPGPAGNGGQGGAIVLILS